MNKSNWSFFVGWLLLALTGGFVGGCHKQDFLGKSPNSTLIVPTTLSDFQSLLDNDQVMNFVPALGDLSADNYYMADDLWQTVGTRVQNAYLWKPDIFEGQGSVEDWNYPYQQVYYANVVLDGLEKVKTDNSNLATWNSIKGQALFTRAFGLYNAAQLFAPAYDVDSAAIDIGIPLRLAEDVQAPVIRNTVKQNYDQVTGDLRIAAGILPPRVSMTYTNRATRPAALAMLARVYLSMRKYDSAMIYADSVLRLNLPLLDYNGVPVKTNPFPKQNTEILYQAVFVSYGGSNAQVLAYGVSDCFVDSTLIKSYDGNDLRLALYFASLGGPGLGLNGSYAATVFPFGGLATDELYLIRAECRARAGDTIGTANDLNTLLAVRWKTGTFRGITFGSTSAALDTVLLERRKELPFRNVRWSDLRRLNKENASGIWLTRKTNGITYTLAPNDKRYVLPIPPDVLRLSGIADNPRQ